MQISKMYYLLLGMSIGGIIGSSYYLLNSISEEEDQNTMQPKEIIQPKLFEKVDISDKFNEYLDSIKESIKRENNSSISEEVITRIIGVLKEYSDFLFDERNKYYIQERRHYLAKSKDNKYYEDKYLEYCSEYFDLYNFSLKTARKYIMKMIKLRRKCFNTNWEKYSSKDFIYFKINYYQNLFYNLSVTNAEFEADFVKLLFENYARNLISEVHKLEVHLNNEAGIGTEEYAVKLNQIKLRLSDELHNLHHIDDKELKYLAITKYELHNKNTSIRDLLEKVNGIELISIGFS